MAKLRVLICDDSLLIRRFLADMIGEEPDMEVVGQARDGEEAVKLALELRPDVITMDVEMPKATGHMALAAIMKQRPTPVVMVSTLTERGAEATLQALALGAYDFVTKPMNGASTGVRLIKDELLVKLRHSRDVRLAAPPVRARPVPSMPALATDKVVLIAASTGGPRALSQLWEQLPKGFQAPILIVQHMPAGFTASFARRLDQVGTIPVREARNGDMVERGVAFLAPGGQHMELEPGGRIRLHDAPLLHGVRPAADYLFLSAAKVYGNRCLGVVLTGMGKDGAQGALAVRHAGGTVLGESEASCTVYGMPRAAKEVGAVSGEFPIGEMGSALVASASGRVARAS